MTNKQYELGIKNLTKIDGKAGEQVINSLEDIAPDLGKYIVEFAFGEVYVREDLSFEEREMITLASLLSQGDTENQLLVHIKGALNIGLSEEKIIGVFIQCIPYVGFPKVLNAVNTAKKIFSY
ncbi:carboxymuconolactone decarboxylase family protein [Enterococcus faecalis]|nr:carboxymuconolactone decarboxylase family protein [Enterococcus faecalis]